MNIEELLRNYNLADVSIATIGSHSALQILHGAKEEGFKTALIVKKDRLGFYKTFDHLVDKYVVVNNWSEVLDTEVQEELLNSNAILVPHGSFVEYVGPHNILNKLRVPLFGSKKILLWEANQLSKMKLLEEAGIKVPKTFRDPEEVDRPVIVKLSGAKGGRGYFLASSPEEVRRGIEKLKLKEGEYIIQEYVIGVPAYFHIFNSKILDRIEIMGMDIRYESNVDGLRRLPPKFLDRLEIAPSFTVVGNIPMVLRESLLIDVYNYASNFVKTTKELVGEELVGPFCLESIIKENGEIVVFEFSGRIVAGTNLYVHGSPYSYLYWNEPMSMGRRIAREIKLAIEKGRLSEVLT